MKRRLPPLNALRSFHAAARHASFRKAAEELGVTHGAVSRQVANLEAYLHLPLFRRTTRRVVLTQDGEMLLATLDRAFETIDQGVGQIMAARAGRPLAVSCIATFAMRWLIPRLPRFQSAFPEIEVRLSAPVLPENVAPADTEIAIRVAPSICPPDREKLDFLPEQIGAVLSPEALAQAPIAGPADLGRHVLLHTASRPDAWTDWALAGSYALPIGVGRRFETFYFMLQAASSGLGVAIGPLPLVADDLAAGRLVAPLGFVPSGRSYHALYRKRDAADPRVRAFCAWLAQEGGATTADDPPSTDRCGR